MYKYLILILLSFLSINTIAQTIIFDNIEIIRTKHFYNNIITKNEKIISYPDDTFTLITTFEMNNKVIKKFKTNYSIKDSLLTIYRDNNSKIYWHIIINETNNIILQKNTLSNNSKIIFYPNSIIDVIRYYEYKKYKNNDTLQTLVSAGYRFVREDFGIIYSHINGRLKIETLNEIISWKIRNAQDTLYKYKLERKTPNGFNETCNANILIPLTPFNTTRFRNGVIIKDIYKKNDQIFDTITGQYEPIYIAVDEMPQFPGGVDALKKEISSNLFLNIDCKYNTNTVFVNFVVCKDGSVKNVCVVRGIDKEVDEIAFYTVSVLPKFIPGKLNGENVNVWYAVPVVFQLF